MSTGLPAMMPARRPVLAALLGAALLPGRALRAATPSAMNISFRDTTFVHRWSRGGQHEFTPVDDADLSSWRDMLTFNVHGNARSAEALAGVANQVLANYERVGKVVRTRSVPRSATTKAEHFIAAVLGQPAFLEAAFARCLQVENASMVMVVSHRVYGQKQGPAMSAWLAANGNTVEQALMGWTRWPSVERLDELPRSES